MRTPHRLKTNRGKLRLAIVMAALASLPAHALINPKFTPVELVRQAETIAQVELAAPDEGKVARGMVSKAFKGTVPAKELTFDLGKMQAEERAEFERAFGESKIADALVFWGSFAGATQNERQAAPVFLHVGSKWFALAKTGEAAFEVRETDANMQAVWNGADDMLARCVAYVLADPAAEAPAQAGAAWGEPQRAGEVKGDVHGAVVADWNSDGKPGVWILASGGDAWVEAADDQTTTRPIGTRSLAGAAGAFLAGGKVALVSWDGKGFSLVKAGADGKFAVKPLALEFDGPVVGMHPLSVKGGTGLVVAGPSSARLFTDLDGKSESVVLATSEAAGSLGEATASLVADFNNDGAGDLLWMFSEGSVLLRGKSDGQFEPPATLLGAGSGKGPVAAVVADLDADGLLDVVAGGARGARLLLNTGTGFRQHLDGSGEPSYIVQPGIRDVMAGDVNSDGRQDVVFLYPTQGALLFFNRGFASFGFAIDMDIKDAMEESADGLLAGAAAQFAGRAVTDLLLVTKSGAVVRLPRSMEEQPGLGIVVAAPKIGGPITVGATLEHRRLGSWSVGTGGAPGFFGIREPGPVTVDWVGPGGERGKNEVIVENGRVFFEIPASTAD